MNRKIDWSSNRPDWKAVVKNLVDHYGTQTELSKATGVSQTTISELHYQEKPHLAYTIGQTLKEAHHKIYNDNPEKQKQQEGA